MIEQNKLEELQKCMNSPYYFFTNYLNYNNEYGWSKLTEEEFNFIFNQLVQKNGK